MRMVFGLDFVETGFREGNSLNGTHIWLASDMSIVTERWIKGKYVSHVDVPGSGPHAKLALEYFPWILPRKPDRAVTDKQSLGSYGNFHDRTCPKHKTAF